MDGSSITAAGIAGNSVTLGRVTDKVDINLTFRGNRLYDDSPSPYGIDSNGEVYGIKASTLNLTGFNGNITIDTDAAVTSSYGIYASRLTSTTNLYGFIRIGEKKQCRKL